MACCQLVFHILRYRRSVVSEDVHVLKQSADTGRLGTSATKQTTASPNALKTEQNGSITSNKPPIATLPDNTPIRLRHPNHRFIAFFLSQAPPTYRTHHHPASHSIPCSPCWPCATTSQPPTRTPGRSVCSAGHSVWATRAVRRTSMASRRRCKASSRRWGGGSATAGGLELGIS